MFAAMRGPTSVQPAIRDDDEDDPEYSAKQASSGVRSIIATTQAAGAARLRVSLREFYLQICDEKATVHALPGSQKEMA